MDAAVGMYADLIRMSISPLTLGRGLYCAIYGENLSNWQRGLYVFEEIGKAAAIAGAVGGAVSKATTLLARESTVVTNTVQTLRRPYIRKSTREAVEESAAKDSVTGKFLDANTLEVIEGKYHLGHKYGEEFWRLRNSAIEEGLTQAQFNNRLNNPTFTKLKVRLII